MKMKNKILLTILPVLIIGIVAINMSFGLFFQSFILQSEQDKIYASAESITTYLDEVTTNYLGTVNDWAHWDDTYYFVENSNTSFIESNLTESALQALNTNIMIFLDNDDSIVYQIYNDSDEGILIEFPSSVSENIDDLIAFSNVADDTSGILNIGDNYYFVASSHTLDSLEVKDTNGTLIIGREINDNVIAQMEKVSGLSIVSMNVLGDINRFNKRDSFNILEIDYDENSNDPINIDIAVVNDYDSSETIVISMIMPRTAYIRGMKRAIEFSLVNTTISLILSFIVFLLVGKFITKPFSSLIQDVKSLDISKSNMNKIPESGKDEFSFLRKSINALMSKIASSQNELIKSREEMHTTLLSIGEGIITIDKNNMINFMNPVAEKMTGWDFEDASHQDLESVVVIQNENKEEPVKSLVEEVFAREETVKLALNKKLISKNGDTLDIEITAAPIKDQYGKTMRCVLAMNDVTENMNQQRYIEHLSYRDTLTGLYNRSFYEEKLKEFDGIEKASLSFIIIDVNGLKLSNDAFGHEAGDQLLIKVAECIETSVRLEDIVCRIGGDEFVVLLPRTGSIEVIHIINRIQSAIEDKKIQGIPISISSGWSTKHHDGEKMESIFKRAEDMMYHNKASANRSQRNQTIQLIMKTLFEKNPREEAHCKRVADLCLSIGKHMNLDLTRIANLQNAALLHDIGKIGIDNECLDKVGPLSEEEWMEIKKHPQISHNILSSSNEYGPLANIVLSHHERWDGKGYPNGLIGEEIPLESRIIALADSFDAMISDRPYRSGMSEEEALLIIKNEAGKQFDPELVSIFLQNCDEIIRRS